MSAMYQDALLSHYRAPHHRREIVASTAATTRRNPVCGDEIRVMVVIADGRIADVAFTGRGCSIATASASMMTDAARGETVADALLMTEQVERMLTGDETPGALPDTLAPLRGVAPFAGRHGCALMPWMALRDCLRS